MARKSFISGRVTLKRKKGGWTDAPFLLGENCSDIENPSLEITAAAVRSAGIMSRFGYEFTFAFSSNRLHISSPTNNESFRALGNLFTVGAKVPPSSLQQEANAMQSLFRSMHKAEAIFVSLLRHLL